MKLLRPRRLVSAFTFFFNSAASCPSSAGCGELPSFSLPITARLIVVSGTLTFTPLRFVAG